MSAAPVSAGAATVPVVYTEKVTVTAGNTAYVTLRAENFDTIASFEVSAFYDPTIFTATGSWEGYLLSGAQTSVNTEVPGEVKLVAMKLDGISGDGELITLQLQAAASATPGVYPITIAIGNAYDTAFAPVSIGSRNGSVKVEEAVETEQFYIYANLDRWTIQKGEILSCQLANWSYQPFVSGDFLITYDHELFEFESVQLDDQLLGKDALYSVNSSSMGQVRVTYATNTPVQSYYLMTVKLKVIADVNAYTEIKTQASNMYRENLSAYLPGSSSSTINLEKLPEVEDHPNAFLETERLVVGEQSQAIFYLEKGADVAAGDFTLTYNPAYLRCVKVEPADTVATQGGMVVVNDNYTNGEIHFSYVNMDAYDETDVALVKITWEPIKSPTSHYRVDINSEGVANESAITLEHITETGCIYTKTIQAATCQSPSLIQYHCNSCGDTDTVEEGEPGQHRYDDTITAPTCTEKGYTTHTCSVCGNSHKDTYTNAKGHTPGTSVEENHKEANCEATGSYEKVVYCTECEAELSREKQTIPAKGHKYQDTVTKPTCTEQGYTTHVCATCGNTMKDSYTTALGHQMGEWSITEATCTVNGSKTRSCGRCDYSETEVIPTPGHNYKVVKTEAACESDGYTTYTCATCGHSYVSDEVKALGHDYVYTVKTEPTLKTEGKVIGTCARCDGTDEQILPKLNEVDYKCEVITEPTEEKEGLARYTYTNAQYGTYTFEVILDKIVTTVLGDVNDDGKVTVLDLMRLANFFAGKDVEIKEVNTDVNGDGKITVLDLMRLANYFAGKAELG